jgi:hypothetical protein
MPKKAQITHERIEYNVFLFDEPLKDSKSLKIFKISLTFRFDKLSNLSKSVHIGENSQILTVSNQKQCFRIDKNFLLSRQRDRTKSRRGFSYNYLKSRCCNVYNGLRQKEIQKYPSRPVATGGPGGAQPPLKAVTAPPPGKIGT